MRHFLPAVPPDPRKRFPGAMRDHAKRAGVMSYAKGRRDRRST